MFKGLGGGGADGLDAAALPRGMAAQTREKHLTEEEKAQIEAMGWDKLWETLRQRLAEQQKRHQGGSK